MSKFNLVMIIDDSEFDRYLSREILKSIDFAKEILEYDSATLALNYLESNEKNIERIPNIIFLDIYMPIMDGFEFINRFKELSIEVIKKCKVCVLSTTVKDEHIFKARQFDKNVMFSSKPITLEFLNDI